MDIKDIINKMSIEEKARILTGKDFWHTVGYEKYNIPSIMMSDGPSGLRKQGENADNLGISGSEKAVCYPPASCISSSFDRELVREFGENLGEEGLSQGINVLLAPAINIQRSPLCGRNFEYFSEDPLLTGILAKEYVKGIQSKGLGVCLKHYAVNSQEKMRFVSNSIVDDRTLFEIYLKAFLITCEAQPTSIMTSYNKVNGEHIAESEFFLNEVMRKKANFNGAFISDWGAVSDIVKSVKAGLNLEMPGGELLSDKEIIEGFKQGKLTIEDIDKRVYELLSFIFSVSNQPQIKYDKQKYLDFAQKSLEQSVVLLKNEKILPLEKNEKILLVGEFCKNSRYQGAGSCKVNLIEKDSLIEVLKQRNIVFDYVDGYNYNKKDVSQTDLINEAVEKAKNYKKVVIVVGYPEYEESEGYDRKSLSLPNEQNILIEKISQVNSNVVVVINCGSPISMDWKDEVKGIIYENFCGCQGGKALTNILYGDVNPSGKLSQTFPKQMQDIPCYDTFSTDDQNVIYKESIFVGYRYYSTANKSVLYPFGYGLSYTTFTIDLVSSDNEKIVLKVKNTGLYDGKEVIQVYKNMPNSNIFRPKIELIEFAKVFLKSGEEKQVTIKFKKEMFYFYNTEISDFDIENGEYNILVGNSSDNLNIKVTLNINGNSNIIKNENAYFNVKDNNFKLDEFKKIYKKDIVPYIFKKPYTRDSLVKELNNSFWGKIIISIMQKNQNTQGEMMKRSLNDIPLRAVLMAGYDRQFLDGVVLFANGKILKGLKKIKSKK